MKNLIISLVLLGSFMMISSSSYALKFRIKGSGGVETQGQNQVICPNKSGGVCAIISGNLRDIFNLWWENREVVKDEKFMGVDIVYYLDNGRSITEKSVDIQMLQARLTNDYEPKKVADVEGNGIIILNNRK